MVRTQIQLRPEQAEDLKRVAAARGVSMAEVIREAVDSALAQTGGDPVWDRALETIGVASDASEEAIGEQHDAYVADAYSA